MNTPKPIVRNQNAAVGGTSAIGGGALVVYLLNLVGLHIDAYGGAVIAGGVSVVALFVGRRGLRGLAELIWRGSD